MIACARPQGRHRRLGVAAALVVLVTISRSQAQSPVSGSEYDRLSAAQQGVLGAPPANRTATDGAAARDRYNAWPAAFRSEFARVTGLLAALVLSDPENGEVLGSVLDLIEEVEAPAVNGSAVADPPDLRLAIRLATGARDKLRRSAEFELDHETARSWPAYVHHGPPPLRLALTSAETAVVVVGR